MAEEALYRTFKKVSGSGDKLKQSKQTEGQKKEANSKGTKETGNTKKKEEERPSSGSDLEVATSANKIDFTDSMADETSEKNTDAKQNGSKQPSEQDERKNGDSNTQTESRNRDPPPQSAMDQQQNKKRLSLSGRIGISLKNNLTLVERLARHLDKERRYGVTKCWKHLAEHFKVDKYTYNTFTCSLETSPTENLFEYLNTNISEPVTIGKLTDGLASIERRDVIEDVIEKYKKLDKSLTDETAVGSLFASHPSMIGEMALMLDVNELGKKNWRFLADVFKVDRGESQNFTKSIEDDPAKKLLEVLESRYPRMTVGDLIKKLNDRKWQVVSDVLTNCKDVTESSLLSDLWDLNYDAANNLCNHLNHGGTSTRRAWRILGHDFKILKEDLDTFSPHEQEVISPMEALVNHLGGAQPNLTFKEFIAALYSIDRKDVVEKCFPDLGKQYEDSLAQSLSQPTREQIKPTTSLQETTV